MKLERRLPESGLTEKGLASTDFRRKRSLNFEVFPTVGGVRVLSKFGSSLFELLARVLVEVLLLSWLRRSFDRGLRGDGVSDAISFG